MGIRHGGLQPDSVPPLGFRLSKVFCARVSKSELKMSDGVVGCALYCRFQNVNCVGLLLLAIQYCASEYHSCWIRRKILQNGVVYLGSFIQAVLLDQELDVCLSDCIIFWMLRMDRTELRNRFV